MSTTPQLVLGSSSPYRKELLERLHLEFITDSPDIDETPLEGETPEELAMRLSAAKAAAVSEKHPGAVVIGSDQVLELDGKPLGKPGNHENAVRQLLQMSGKSVTFHSAMAVGSPSGEIEVRNVKTRLKIRKLNLQAIETYLNLEKPYRCAGSAKIEKLGIALIERFESEDPTAIIGLPLIALTEMLASAGISVLPGLIPDESGS